MDPKEFLRVANDLLKLQGAAEVRSAVSRAYYAAFHVAADILAGMDFRISKGPAGHGEVCHRLSNCGNADVETIGQDLFDFKGIRNDADYKLLKSEAEKPTRAKLIVQNTATIIEDLKTHCNGPDRDNIKRAIKAWEIRTSNRPST